MFKTDFLKIDGSRPSICLLLFDIQTQLHLLRGYLGITNAALCGVIKSSNVISVYICVWGGGRRVCGRVCGCVYVCNVNVKFELFLSSNISSLLLFLN